MKSRRASWSGHLGFVLAASASAIGLGNLWRFPACAAGHGGGVFLVLYILLVICFGIPLLMTEITLGRRTRRSPSRTFRKLNKRWWFAGALAMAIPAIILPYYCVVGGWVTKYFVASFAQGTAALDFMAWSAQPWSVGAYSLAFALATIVLILLGVRQGIEKSNHVMMPALLLLTIGTAVFVVCQKDMSAGLGYYLMPDLSRFSADGAFSWSALAKTLLSAMGQMFFSLSIAMGIMITYGSYVPKDDSIPKASSRIAFCDTFVALLAGVIIIPAAYAFGGTELAEKSGVGLMFVSLPKVFAAMHFGRFVEAAFFTLVLFAALTSAISLAETVTSSLCDFTLWPRRRCALITFAWMVLAGTPSVLSMGALEGCDFLADIILMPVCAFLTCIFVGWVAKSHVVLDEIGEQRPFARTAYRVFIRYLAPVFIAVVFVAGLLNALGVVTL